MTPPAHLRVGVIGVGLVGAAHVEAVGRTGLANVVAVAAGSASSAESAARRHGVATAHADWRALIDDREVRVVHNCTPNHLHSEVGEAALTAGKHLISEKPIAPDLAAAEALVAASRSPGLITALCHNYRHYPMVTRARELVAEGAIGEVFHVHGAYLQDWLSGPEVRNWRLESGQGASITFADIGTHWCDLASYLTGRRIEQVCALTGSRHARVGDDHAGVLLRLSGGIAGTVVASQVSPGSKNGLRIQLDGSEGSLVWVQERPELLWLGRSSGPNELHTKSPHELGPASAPLAHLPPGHPEGWNTTFVNLFRLVYRRILRFGDEDPAAAGFATFEDGLALLRVVEAVVRSNAVREWVDVEAVEVTAG